MAPIEYPLERVLEIKRKRVEDAEKELKKRKEELEEEKRILLEKEEARDKVLDHKNAKLKQLRDEMDRATRTHKVQQMKDYLKIVEKNLEEEEKKVQVQKEEVQKAKERVEEAKQEVKLKQLEVDKLEVHKKDWIKEIKKELKIREGREQDELGNVMFLMKKRQGY